MPTSDDDLVGGISDGAPPATPNATSGWTYPFSPDVIRTIAGEGAPAAIATALWNRKQNSGLDYDSLVTMPNQFEARTGSDWTKNSELAVNSPRFQKTLAAAAPILTGAAPPLGPWDSYYSPRGQIIKGRKNPDGTPVVPGFAAQAEAAGQHGVNIGGNLFYSTGWNGGGAADDHLVGGVSDVPNAPPATHTTAAPNQQANADPFTKAFGVQPSSSDPNLLPIVDANGKQVGLASGPQSDTVRGLLKAGRYDPNADEGSETHPYAYPAGTRPVRGGTWYIDHDTGKLIQYQDPDSPVQTLSVLGQAATNPLALGANAAGLADKLGLPTDPRAEAMTGGFLSGALLGGKNEAAAAIQSVPGLFNGRGFTNAFTQNLAANDARDLALRTRFPLAHDVSAVAGGGASALAGDAAGAALLRGAGAAFPEAADVIASNPFFRTAATVARRGAVGAGYGGAQGYLAGGPGVTEAERERQSATGAEWGVGLGEALPAAGDVLGAGGRVLTGAGGAPIDEAAAKVGKLLINKIQADGMDPADVIAGAKANPTAPAFHAGGPNLQGTAEALVGTPGPAQSQLTAAVAEHQANAPAQIKADIGKALGGRGDYLDTLNQTLAARKTSADQGMAAIQRQPVQLSPDAIQAVRSPLAQTAIRNAAQNALASADPVERAAGADLNNLADVALDHPASATMTIRNAQDISKSLLDAGQSAMVGGDQSRGFALKNLGRAIRNNAADPEQGGNAAYGSWLAKYGDDSDNADALKLGHDATYSGAQKNTAAQVGQTLQDMSPAAQDYYRKGVAEALIQQTRTNGVGAMRSLLRNEDIQDKVKMAFPDQSSYDSFLNTVKQRVQEQNANGQVLGNSRTYARQAAAADLEQQPLHPIDVIPHALEAAGHIGMSNPAGLAGQATRLALKNFPRADRSIIGNPLTNALLGRALRDPDALERTINAGLGGNRAIAGGVPRPNPVRAITPLAIRGGNLMLNPPAPLPQGPVAVPAGP